MSNLRFSSKKGWAIYNLFIPIFIMLTIVKALLSLNANKRVVGVKVIRKYYNYQHGDQLGDLLQPRGIKFLALR
jgi:hypothetical protein